MAGFLSTVKEWFSSGPSEEEQALIEACAADPDNDEPRLAYAQWLTDKDDPRGEFIRAEIELHRLPDDDPQRAALADRRDELLDKHGKKWLKPLKELELEPLFAGKYYVPGEWIDRGMIDHITIAKRGLIPGKAERLWQLAPTLRRLTFERCSPDWEGIAACPEMERVIDLDLSADLKIYASDLQDLLGSPHLANIELLNLNSKKFGGELIDAIVRSSLTNLKKLAIEACDIDDEAISKLLAWDRSSNLEMLYLSGNKLSPHGVQAVVSCPALAGLEFLSLAGNNLGPDAAPALKTANLPKLLDLQLEGNWIGADGVRALAEGNIGRLTQLNLTNNQLGDEGLQALAESGLLSGVTLLQLSYNDGTFDGLRAILESPHLGELAELEINSFKAGTEGAELLIGCEKLANLEKLNCYGLECGDEWEAKLKEHFGEDVVSM